MSGLTMEFNDAFLTDPDESQLVGYTGKFDGTKYSYMFEDLPDTGFT